MPIKDAPVIVLSPNRSLQTLASGKGGLVYTVKVTHNLQHIINKTFKVPNYPSIEEMFLKASGHEMKK